MLTKWRKWMITQRKDLNRDLKLKNNLYSDAQAALAEWKRAYCAYQEAVGKDEVDFAIHTLEAAEIKYQIVLKEAKSAELNWCAFQHSTMTNIGTGGN